MKTMIKNAAILFAITLIAGFVLGFVYQNTKGLIAEREALDKKNACMEVFKEAKDFKAVPDFFTQDIRDDFNQNGYENETIDELVEAVDEKGNTLGYVFTITTSQGYAGDIQFTLGIKNDGTVNGISLLAINETAGLGMQAEDVLKPQFANKNVELFEYTKNGSTTDNQIDAISGATITTNAITSGVNSGLYYLMQMNKACERLYNGIIKENPTLVLMLGMCPTLAVTTSAINGLGMGLTTMVVLALSNVIISLLRKIIPDKIRIPAFIVIIASFVTILQLLLQAYLPDLYTSLGIYIPLIVVNCIILGRAEAYAYKNPVLPSLFDGLGMGLGFSIALTCIGLIREFLGGGTLFGTDIDTCIRMFFQLFGGAEKLGITLKPCGFVPISIFKMAPGAFFVLAVLTSIQNKAKIRGAKKGKDVSKIQSGCGNDCLNCSQDGCEKRFFDTTIDDENKEKKEENE